VCGSELAGGFIAKKVGNGRVEKTPLTNLRTVSAQYYIILLVYHVPIVKLHFFATLCDISIAWCGKNSNILFADPDQIF
jgi:hypothetical protein